MNNGIRIRYCSFQSNLFANLHYGIGNRDSASSDVTRVQVDLGLAAIFGDGNASAQGEVLGFIGNN